MRSSFSLRPQLKRAGDFRILDRRLRLPLLRGSTLGTIDGWLCCDGAVPCRFDATPMDAMLVDVVLGNVALDHAASRASTLAGAALSTAPLVGAWLVLRWVSCASG